MTLFILSQPFETLEKKANPGKMFTKIVRSNLMNQVA